MATADCETIIKLSAVKRKTVGENDVWRYKSPNSEKHNTHEKLVNEMRAKFMNISQTECSSYRIISSFKTRR